MNRRSFVSLVTKAVVATTALNLASCSPSEKEQVTDLYNIYAGLRRCSDIIGDSAFKTQWLHEMRFYIHSGYMQKFEKKSDREIDGHTPQKLRDMYLERYTFIHDRMANILNKIDVFIESDTEFSNEFCRRVSNNVYGKTLDKLIEDYFSVNGHGDINLQYTNQWRKELAARR